MMKKDQYTICQKQKKHENYFEDAAFYYINVGDFVLYRNFC